MTNPPTVLDRLIAAGIADDRARAHLAAGLVRVDGEVADEGRPPAPPPSRVVIDGAEWPSGTSPAGIARR